MNTQLHSGVGETHILESAARRGRWSVIGQILLGRLLILGGLFIAVSAASPHNLRDFYLFAAVAFVITIPYTIWLRKSVWVERTASLQFLLDAVITTGLIHYTGGINSQLFFIYPLIVISGGIVVSGTFALKTTALCVLLYALMVVLEAMDIVVYCGPQPNPYGDLNAVVRDLMLRIFVFVFYSAASSYLADFCSNQARQLQRNASLVEAIFDRMPAALLAVRTDGTIAFANRAAGELLGTSKESLPGVDIYGWFAGEKPDLQCPATAGPRTWHIRRSDGLITPVVLDASNTPLPTLLLKRGQQNASPPPQAADDDPIWIVTMRDITAEIKAKEVAHELTRLRTAVQVVTELAHHVRNSLTTIQGATEVSERIIRDISRAHNISASDQQDLATMCESVSRQIEHLDERLSDFLDGVVENPAELVRQASEAYAKYFEGGGPPRQ